jgi:hypothetical protein
MSIHNIERYHKRTRTEDKCTNISKKRRLQEPINHFSEDNHTLEVAIELKPRDPEITKTYRVLEVKAITQAQSS